MIRPRRVCVVASNESRTLAKNVNVVILVIVAPLILILLLKPGFDTFGPATGSHAHVPGADYAVPGFALMFAFFIAALLGLAFFNEHSWGTWTRLRASSTSSSEIMFGKLVPYGLLTVIQLSLLLTVGRIALGLRISGSLVALVLVFLAVAAVVVAFGVFLVAICANLQQMTALDNLITIVFAAVGGAVFPIEVLPHWVRAIAPLTPHYWAMDALRAVIVQGGGIARVLPDNGVLLLFAAALFLVTARRFRFDETKLGVD